MTPNVYPIEAPHGIVLLSYFDFLLSQAAQRLPTVQMPGIHRDPCSREEFVVALPSRSDFTQLNVVSCTISNLFRNAFPCRYAFDQLISFQFVNEVYITAVQIPWFEQYFLQNSQTLI